MAFQIPNEAHPVAAGVLTFAFISEICGILLVWLVWAHRERTSYVACIAYFTLLSTTMSIIQQFHVYIDWNDVITTQFHHTLDDIGDPELVIANSSTGLDLVLFYIQYCCYNIEATFVLFWAFSLTQSVYGWSAKPHLRRTFKYINVAGKVVSVVLPVVMISLLQVESVRHTFIGFLLVADILLIVSLAGGCGFLLAILWKYLQSRRQFKTWSVGYGNGSVSHTDSAQRTKPAHPKSKGIYDNWLLVRFTIAFIMLSIFELTNVLFQLAGQRNMSRDSLSTTPDTSVERAKLTCQLFMPGLLPSFLAFFVFGTTKPFLHHMYRTFVPKRFQKNLSPPGQSMPWVKSSNARPPSKHNSVHVRKTQEDSVERMELSVLGASKTGRLRSGDFNDEWPILEAGHRAKGKVIT
ncbi:hypothetical protein F4778DRAFT_418487 [Xylariomycetidae sp. FL2044]|nr:hypothetical protein F4778DRAFT_418487 [Xylariomycetidae sp. FL2044]